MSGPLAGSHLICFGCYCYIFYKGNQVDFQTPGTLQSIGQTQAISHPEKDPLVPGPAYSPPSPPPSRKTVRMRLKKPSKLCAS